VSSKPFAKLICVGDVRGSGRHQRREEGKEKGKEEEEGTAVFSCCQQSTAESRLIYFDPSSSRAFWK
jgi:hypothetical protein